MFVAQPRRWLAATIGTAPSLFTDAPLRALVERHLGFDRLEDARLPVHLVATDLVTGQGVALSKGPAVSAVLASAAQPSATTTRPEMDDQSGFVAEGEQAR